MEQVKYSVSQMVAFYNYPNVNPNYFDFESVKAANDYARANDIDDLPDAEFYN